MSKPRLDKTLRDIGFVNSLCYINKAYVPIGAIKDPADGGYFPLN